MLIVSEAELRQCIDMPAAIDAVEHAFAALARGQARLPPPVGLELPEVEGEVHLKGAHLAGAPFFVFKVASGFYQNPRLGLPSGSGLVLVFDARTGQPMALLLDNSFLTDVRTGAAGGVAAKYLARDQVRTVAVLGAGIQARMQLRALACVRELSAVRIWNHNPERAESCAAELREEMGCDVRPSGSVEAAVGEADVVITTTPSRTPLVRAEWLMPGVHVTAVGSDGPGKQELAAEVLKRADKVVVDRKVQCVAIGELQHAVAAGLLTDDQITGEMGDLVLGRIPGRERDDEITVADLTGVGVQDAAIGSLALQRATELGLGYLAVR